MSQAFLDSAAQWAREREDVAALVLVGSWARGTNRPDSDIDLVILTEKQMDYVGDHGFAARFGFFTSGCGAAVSERSAKYALKSLT